MGKLFIPAEQEIEGPWLLSQMDFENLDKILDTIFRKLKTAVDNEMSIHPEVYKYNKPELKKNIILTSRNKTKLLDDTLLGILKDQKLNNLQPDELFIVVGKRYSGFAFLLSITPENNGTLDYSVECINEEIKDEIKYEIDRWIEDLKPNKLSHFWSYTLPYFLILLGIIWFITLFNFLFYTPNDNFKNDLRLQADSLLSNGIDINNQNEAVEIILKLQTEYTPKNINDKKTLQPKVLKLLIISIFCFTVLIITPKTTIGLGKYKQKLKFYKFWNKFVLISIPSVIILPKLLNLLNELIF